MTTADGTVLGTTQIASGGAVGNRWNLVLLSDGYRDAEMDTYRRHATAFVDALRATPPFDALWGAVNVFRVDVTSTDSGTDDPATCADGSTGAGATPRTYFDGTLCSGGMRRLLTVNNTTARAVAGAQVPGYTRVLVLVNTTLYGGSGGNPVGAYASAYTPASEALGVAIHELGHTGFALADEYGGCRPGQPNRFTGTEPDQANITTVTDRATTKWADLIAATTALPTQSVPDCTSCAPLPPSPVPAGTVGLFEEAQYTRCGIYRPQYDCMMREVDDAFCAVCQRRIRTVLGAFNAPEAATALRTVEVSAPEINTFFDPDGSIVVNDVAPRISLPGTSAPGFIQSRLLPQGLPGTAAAGLFGYEYRVSFTEAASTGAPVGVSRLEVDIGAVTRLDYAGTGAADMFVVTRGGLGNVRPSAVEQTAAGRLVIRFDTPVRPGDTSFFMGYVSPRPPRTVAIRIVDTAGRMYDVEGRAPAP